MRMGLAVAVAMLVPGCAKLNPAFEDAGEGSGAGTSMGSGGTAPTDTAATLPTASASGVTGSSTLPTTTELGSDDGPASDSDVMQGDWWDRDYGHRVELVFAPRSEPLLGFVTYVPVSLSPSLLEDVGLSQLAFVDADSGTRISAEITTLGPVEGDVIAWVQLPVWKKDESTSVFLYFGADAPQAPSAMPWTGHVAVWHMDEFAQRTTRGAAGSADAMAVGLSDSPIAVVYGVTGGALAFDGGGHRLRAVLPSRLAEETFLVSG